ncbi:MAG: hypothetical protein IIC57_02530 [Proteobacteria bacterium]|nr:hypothetical protein [Pseudomonadota bacterium]
MARVRSPNYPSISLPAALERIRKIHAAEGTNDIDRGSLVQMLGYIGLTGPSAKLLSSLGKYGLITKVGLGEVKISDLAMDILFGEPSQKTEAIWRAANSPSLFAELNEKWPERQPGDQSLHSFLARKGFSLKVLDRVMTAYRDTMSLVSGESGVYDTSRNSLTDPAEAPMQPETHTPPAPTISPLINKGFDIGFVGTAIRMSGMVGSKSEAAKVIKALQALQDLLPDDSEGETEDMNGGEEREDG